jgi:hypothetical protein
MEEGQVRQANREGQAGRKESRQDWAEQAVKQGSEY